MVTTYIYLGDIMKFILDCAKGVILGAGAILPGISSGVLCVVFGIYEKLVDSVLNFFNDIKKNSRFLLPIILGIVIGVVLFGNLLRFLFNAFPSQTKLCFIGLILGSIPSLFKTANQTKGFRLHYLIYTIATFLFTLFLLSLENILSSTISSANTNVFFLIFAGFIMSIGVVVPGVSSSVLLMILGIYDIYLFSIATMDLFVLIPMGIGLLFGGFAFLKLIKYSLEHFHIQTYYSIIGFVLGSIPILYPGIELNFTGFISIILFFLGLYVAQIFEKAH